MCTEWHTHILQPFIIKQELQHRYRNNATFDWQFIQEEEENALIALS